MSFQVVVYALTSLAILSLLWLWLRAGRRTHGVKVGGPRRLHLVAGLLGAAGWITYLATTDAQLPRRDLVGIVSLFFWWLAVGAGLLLMTQFFPTKARGRHADSRRRFAPGALLGLLAHLAVAVCAVVFTYAYMIAAV